MSISLSNSPSPRFAVEQMRPEEINKVMMAQSKNITMLMDLYCIFGFRGDNKEKYSLEVRFGDKVQKIDSVVTW